MLTALQYDVERLPTPRADGDREALRILLGARHDLTTAHTAQTNRLRALLLGGDDTDRQTARAALSEPVLAALARRRSPRDADRAQAVRHGELRRLAIAVRDGGVFNFGSSPFLGSLAGSRRQVVGMALAFG